MAIAETARLIASLELKDNLSKGADRAIGKLGKLEGTVGRIGSAAGKGLATAGANIAKIGAIGAVAVGTQVKAGLDSLAQLEDATTAVDGAIKQMGLTGKVTSGQIATWANEIEASVDAAFDDKDITRAASTLIRFGKIAPKNIRPALQVITDLAVKTGSVDSAASLLGKALADPTKAAGKLARAGVILTKAQQKQIAAFIKAGKVGSAQKVILDALTKSTEGAAKASKGEYADSLNVLADVTEDAQRALATGFLPVITKVRDILTRELAKPETLNRIREFGKGLAGGLEQLIDVAQKVPWGTIGESLRIAGLGGKAVLDAFLKMPPWVQTAVITGWGLNKLTGGALGTIVGELGKGLIKGVLGMTAGVVNAKAGVVNVSGPVAGGGGVGGAAGTAGAAAGGLGAIATAGVFLTAAVASEIGHAVADGVQGIGNDILRGLGANETAIKDLNRVQDAWQKAMLPTLGTIADDLDKVLGLVGVSLTGPARQNNAPIPKGGGQTPVPTTAAASAAVVASIKAADAHETAAIKTAATDQTAALDKVRADLGTQQTTFNQILNRMGQTLPGDTRSESRIPQIQIPSHFDVSAKLDTSQVVDLRTGSDRTTAAVQDFMRTGIASWKADTRSEGSAVRQTLAQTSAQEMARLVDLRGVVASGDERIRSTTAAGNATTAARIAALTGGVGTQTSVIRAGDSRSEAAAQRIQAATSALGPKVNAVAGAVRTIPPTIRSNRPIVNTTTNVQVSVSTQSINKHVTYVNKLGYTGPR